MITTKKISIDSLHVDITGMEMIPVTVLGDYRKNGASGVVDAGCFSVEENEDLLKAGIVQTNSWADSWKNPSLLEGIRALGHACSCCIKKLDNGTLVMGRNMDMPISFGPAIIFRTKGDGKHSYDTVNIAYAPSGFTFDQIAEVGGIPKVLFTGAAISSTDVLNSEGLYLQIDMRDPVDCRTSSSNPESDYRVVTFNLIRLLGTRCATIDEALEYLKGLDIYDSVAEQTDWSVGIAAMDKTGRYGVIEFVDNKIIWNEGREGVACGHANFYWAHEASNVRFGAGLGRWRKLMEYYYDIECQKDMEEAMKKIRYSNFITDGSLSRDWKVDWITEVNDKIPYFMQSRLDMMYSWRDEYGIKIDEKHLAKVLKLVEKEKELGGPVWSFEFLRDPENYYDVITFMDLFIKCFAQLPIEAQKLSGYMECSTIGYTANNKELGYDCHFFEMNDVYHIGIYETKIDIVTTEKKFGNA